MIADIVLAEKGAMIGFAGARVIEQNTDQRLPENFQTADFQLAHGHVDEVISREEMRAYLTNILKLHNKSYYINRHKTFPAINRTERIPMKLDTWEIVQKARGRERPTSLDYINKIFDSFIEFHGDKVCSDDHTIVSGLTSICGNPVTVIGQQKGKS